MTFAVARLGSSFPFISFDSRMSYGEGCLFQRNYVYRWCSFHLSTDILVDVHTPQRPCRWKWHCSKYSGLRWGTVETVSLNWPAEWSELLFRFDPMASLIDKRRILPLISNFPSGHRVNQNVLLLSKRTVGGHQYFIDKISIAWSWITHSPKLPFRFHINSFNQINMKS